MFQRLSGIGLFPQQERTQPQPIDVFATVECYSEAQSFYNTIGFQDASPLTDIFTENGGRGTQVMAVWGNKPKIKKKKRKGLPRPRSMITSFITLLVILVFIALWFVIAGPPAPPVPIVTVGLAVLTPTIGPSPQPMLFGTPIVVPRFKPLQITALCTDAAHYTTFWRVQNPNPYPVKFTAITRSMGTWATQIGTVPPMDNGRLGAIQLRAFFERPAVIMSVSADGSDESAFSANDPQTCSTRITGITF